MLQCHTPKLLQFILVKTMLRSEESMGARRLGPQGEMSRFARAERFFP